MGFSAIAADEDPNSLVAEQNARAETVRLMGTATTRVATIRVLFDRKVIEIKLGGMTVINDTAYGCGLIFEADFSGSILNVLLKEKGSGWNNPQPLTWQQLNPGDILPLCDAVAVP